MPLHIKDSATTAAVRELAHNRRMTLTEAVRVACEEALARDRHAQPVSARLAGVHARVKAAKPTGLKADKNFFDAEWNGRK